MPDVVVPIYIVSFIYFPGKMAFLSLSLLCSLMMCANNWIHSDLMVAFGCLHIALPHYNLSEGTELLKRLSGTFCLECMSKILFTSLNYLSWNLWWWGLAWWVFSLPIYLTKIVRIRVLYLIIIIKSEVWAICHRLRLGRETIVCAVCFHILMSSWISNVAGLLCVTSVSCMF